MRSQCFALFAAASIVGCGIDDGAPPADPRAGGEVAAVHAPAAAAQPLSAALPAFVVDERELGALRDPFVPASEAALPPIERDDVAFADTPVRALKVTGTVAGPGEGKAIVVDDKGATLVLAVGERLGQLEKADDGSFAEWRIDRVREGRVFLLREGGQLDQTLVLGETPSPAARKRSASKLGDRAMRR